MVGRLGRGLVFAGFLTFAGAAPGVAQGALSGEIVAADVAGYVVIACFADAELGCDEARSGFAEVAGGGTRADWVIEGLERGPFLVLGWRDVDGDGEAQEHELIVLSDAAGEPRLVMAPDAGLLLRAPDAPTVQDGPVRRSPAATAPATPAPPTPPAAAPTPPAAPPMPPATALHPDLVGVWQQTRASGGDYRDLTTGASFSMTSGFSTLLKLRADATFLFQFYSSGVAPDCAFVSQLDTSIGHAALQGGALVLRPTERRVELGQCARSGTFEPGLDPIVMPAQLTESFDFEGHRTWKLALEGGPVPLELTLLHRPPSPSPPQPAQPEDFVLGGDPPYSDIHGIWSPHPHTDLGFFDPPTDAWYLPEYNGAQHLWLRFSGDGYDLARAWSNYGYGGVCEKDYVYYERGRALLANLEDIGGQGDSFRGHARFSADDARLLVRIRDCGSDDGATLYTLTPQVSYYEWRYRMATDWLVSIPEGFSLSCPWSRSEWQFMVCDSYAAFGASFGRR
jgi:hypothetical protein